MVCNSLAKFKLDSLLPDEALSEDGLDNEPDELDPAPCDEDPLLAFPFPLRKMFRAGRPDDGLAWPSLVGGGPCLLLRWLLPLLALAPRLSGESLDGSDLVLRSRCCLEAAALRFLTDLRLVTGLRCNISFSTGVQYWWW